MNGLHGLYAYYVTFQAPNYPHYSKHMQILLLYLLTHHFARFLFQYNHGTSIKYGKHKHMHHIKL